MQRTYHKIEICCDVCGKSTAIIGYFGDWRDQERAYDEIGWHLVSARYGYYDNGSSFLDVCPDCNKLNHWQTWRD